MRDSVPSGSYSSVCNVLRQWNIPLIPTYRVYRLYDMYMYTSTRIYSTASPSTKRSPLLNIVAPQKWIPITHSAPSNPLMQRPPTVKRSGRSDTPPPATGQLPPKTDFTTACEDCMVCKWCVVGVGVGVGVCGCVWVGV